MCKCIQNCLETCWWHLIEKRFCYDESIALYEVPEKEEKNNNYFDNMAFYDSVSVIAGRAIVTIEPLPEKNQGLVENKPIVQQPMPNNVRKLRWQEEMELENECILPKEHTISRSLPQIYEIKESEEDKSETDVNNSNNIKNDLKKSNMETLKPENLDIENRRKSLIERRMSKSLYLKLDQQPKEVPIIRQQSMPKFYLDTPEESGGMYSGPSTALTSPVPTQSAFQYDLYSVVQMEKNRRILYDQNQQNTPQQTTAVLRKESERSSKLAQLREKIKLRRSKSTLDSVTNLPHSHHHM